MDKRESHEATLLACSRLLHFAMQLHIADDRLNDAVACLSAAAAVAAAQARVHEVIGELREVARTLGKSAIHEANEERDARRALRAEEARTARRAKRVASRAG
jgi:hypothetical protein